MHGPQMLVRAPLISRGSAACGALATMLPQHRIFGVQVLLQGNLLKNQRFASLPVPLPTKHRQMGYKLN